MSAADYVILHRHCSCVSDGWVADSSYAEMQCSACDEEFGLGIPITMDEGRLREHLSCWVARRIREKESA